MAYESKLYVVKKYQRFNSKGELNEALMEEGLVDAQIVAEYELSNFPPIRNFFHPGDDSRNTDCYIYAKDGNTPLFKDCYGDPLKEANLADVIDCLEKLNEKDKTYRRVPPLLGMFRGFHETESEWDEDSDGLAVLHYGH